MSDTTKNPFTPIEMWENVMVTVKDGDDRKQVDAKRYRIRYLVGESEDKRFVDGGTDKVEQVSDKTIFLTSAIHRMSGAPFHYDTSKVETMIGNDMINEQTRHLNRHPACEEHKTVEVIFESPGVECCSMTREEADKQEVPLQYMAGYLLGKSKGLLKVALSRTALDGGNEYFDNIHIIPESAVKQWACLE